MRALLALFACASLAAAAAPATTAPLEQQFQQTVRPFLAKHCLSCHSGASPAAQFDLKAYTNLAHVTKDYPRWALVMERLEAKDMPPKPMTQPPAESSHQVVTWIQALRSAEIKRSAGDPGLVSARRLSNAEYNYTIRDLTGQDMQVTREFPVDPANPAGFDNSGESLTMSPALLNKYLQAAREVANHMVLTPTKLDFAPYPMLVETDREKFAVQRIIQFYSSQPTQYADYFAAAWRFEHRANLRQPTATLATLASLAAEAKLSPKYLQMVYQALKTPETLGPMAKLQQMWQSATAEELVAKTAEMQAFVSRIRLRTSRQFAAPVVKGLPPGSQPLVNWKLKEYAAHRRESDPAALQNESDPPRVAPTIPRYPGLHQEGAPRWAALMAKARVDDMDLVVPTAQRQAYEAAFSRFARVFPDVFYVTERGRYFPDDSQDKGRLLSAGYHSVVGFWRDDTPLMELILDEKAKKELDRLWNEFDYMAQATERTWTQFWFNQAGAVDGKGAEAAAERPVGIAITDPPAIMGMRDKFLLKAAADPKNDPLAPTAINHHFARIDSILRGLEKQRQDAQPLHLQSLVQLASRAYRRPLAKPESDDLLGYYRELRTAKELSHDDAVRETVVSVLMAPDFLYRLDLQDSGLTSSRPAKAAARVAGRPLSSLDLASRLSYFLWSSNPDDELLKRAAAGDLQRPEVLLAQTRRMLKDPRVRGMATEFTGNWLTFRNFEKSNSVDRARFPTFNNELREAMFQEPIRLIEDALQNNRSVLDLIYGNSTFVNPSLAKHYGMPEVKSWTRVDDANRYGRGGLLPMAVFLTLNSPGLRTSPVKRGNWVVQRVLGEIVPPPPPVVPELPHDEATSELPVRDMLAKHRENALCSACHAKIDSFGLAFEGYGPVGNARTKDLAGRVVDTLVNYPGGSTGTAVAGLQNFIREHREKEYLTNFSRKMLAYALNRSLQLSDEITVEQMVAQAPAKGYRIQSFVEAIVTSPQFLNRRLAEKQPVSQLQPLQPTKVQSTKAKL